MSRYLLPLMAGLMLASPLALADEPKRGGEITIVYKDDFDSMDPAIGYSVQSWTPIKAVFDGLMDYKPGTSELVPDLAEGFEVSSDGKTYTFKLRQGVKFHDGTPFTSKDVKATFDRVLNPEKKMVARGNHAKIKSVEIVDDLTVKFHTDGPYPLFVERLTAQAIASEKVALISVPSRRAALIICWASSTPFLRRSGSSWVKAYGQNRNEQTPLIAMPSFSAMARTSLIAASLASGDRSPCRS